MSRANGPDLKNDHETSATTMFHFLYDMAARETVKLRSCDVGEGGSAPIADWGHFTQNRDSNLR